jgi:CDP-paratose 2-epimerase
MKALVTGGAGFIGSTVAAHLLERGWEVTVLDNGHRAGAELHVEALERLGGARLRVLRGDVRDRALVGEAVAGQTAVFHVAGQVAVTTSVEDPGTDLSINLGGTFAVLEAVRALPPAARPAVLYTSTNKVYGRMEDVPVVAGPRRYAYRDAPEGVPETRPLDFHSPYGCSKGAADQYVRDYARIYGLPTVVFRMSCIYGPGQCGTEDQGWLAHFLISAALGRPVTIYGDGRQVRDVLFVDDLVEAFLAALGRIEAVRGEVFNIGGGPANTLSLLELVEWVRREAGAPLEVRLGDWRPGDQRVYVSDIRKAQERLGWVPRIGVPEGLERLWDWVKRHRDLFLPEPAEAR